MDGLNGGIVLLWDYFVLLAIHKYMRADSYLVAIAVYDVWRFVCEYESLLDVPSVYTARGFASAQWSNCFY